MVNEIRIIFSVDAEEETFWKFIALTLIRELVSGIAEFDPSLMRMTPLLTSKMVGLRSGTAVVIDNIEDEVPIEGT